MQLSRMIESALKTSRNPQSIEFVVYADADDMTMSNFKFTNTRLLIGEKQSISKMTNVCYSESKGAVLMYAADDVVFRTSEWDEIVLQAIKNHGSIFFLIHGDDLGQKSTKIATHGFVSRELVDQLGYLLPPYMDADFCDTWLTSIARHTKSRVYLRNLIIEHLHPAWGKANFDQTYLDRHSTRRFWKAYAKYQVLLPLRVLEILKIKFYIRLS